MTAEQFLNALNILESIDEVPGMPELPLMSAHLRNAKFRMDPVKFLRRADDPTRRVIGAEVTRRMGGGV